MRIALLTHQFPSARLGGIGAYTLHNARALAAAGHEPHIFTLQLPSLPTLPPGVTLHEITLPSPAQPPEACAELIYRLTLADAFAGHVLAAHRTTPFDIIEGPEYESPGRGLAQCNIPLITHLHSGSAIARHLQESFGGSESESASAEQAMREALELELLAASDACCAPSHAVLTDTFRAYGVGPFDAEVIPLPFDPPDVPFTPPPAHGPVLYIGRLERLKGAHLLAQAATPFLRDNPAATLRLLGPDTMTAPPSSHSPASRTSGQPPRSMAQWMQGQLARDIASRVTFFGEATREQISRELARCAFVVLPSLRESYSYVACEALAAGRPVVVSSDVGATEVVGEAGLSFSRGNSESLATTMSQLYKNPVLQAELAQRAYVRARDALAPERSTAARILFYENVLGQRQRHGLIPSSLASLPPFYRTRCAAAEALAEGDSGRAIRLLASAGVAWNPADLSTPGSRLLQRLQRHPHPRTMHVDWRARDMNGRWQGGGGVNFYLYGAGRHTERLLQEQARWESHGHCCIGIIDDHPRFQVPGRSTFRSLPVLSLAMAAKRLGLGDVVILSSDAFEDQLFAQAAPLRARGAAVYRLYGA